MRRNHGFLEIAFPTFVPIGEQELKPVSISPSHVYTADDNDTSSNEVPSTEEIRVAQNGYHLLSSWTTAPDILEDDSFDPERVPMQAKQRTVDGRRPKILATITPLGECAGAVLVTPLGKGVTMCPSCQTVT
jgi:hypothetical protein